jgi:Na+-translocating ferredoxin:NAD+ oxidoreductase subunit B
MGIMLICLLLVSIGGLLTFARARRRPATENLADRIDAVLPQTQCTRCGFPACRLYAEAIARGDADIDRCPPGGDEGIRSLARLLGVAAKPLNPAHGTITAKQVAVILEDQCIGCALCLKACPVDAIVGAPQWIHTVIASECTGCELCVAPCPVDCIELRPAAELEAEDRGRMGPAAAAAQWVFARAMSLGLFDSTERGHCERGSPSRIPLVRRFYETKDAIETQRRARSQADHARQRYQARNLRLAREQERENDQARRQREALARPGADAISAALERARLRKQAMRTGPDRTTTRKQ